MSTRRFSLGPLFLALLLLACGSSGGDGPATRTDAPAPTEPGPTLPTPNPAIDYGGAVWDVKGIDARGPYEGQVELAGDKLTRVVRYTTARVEDDRELWWVWRGRVVRAPDGSLGTRVDLQRTDFVVERDGLQRQPSDATPLAVTGHFTWSAAGYDGSYASLGASEAWTPSKVSAPIFGGVDRTVAPSHDAPDSTVKQTLFAGFASFHALPAVKPYTTNKDFQTAQHGFWVDRTDLDFYRAHPNALRVIDKVVDPISLLETLVRANAFRSSFRDKQTYFDNEIRGFVDTTGFVGTSFDVTKNRINPSGDGALWAGVYVATQAYRYWQTGDLAAKANALQTWRALLRLQPITGDVTTFARVLRPAGYGPLVDGWHVGIGEFADVEWKEGGNNDMLKGLFLGYAIGWKLFCSTGTPDPSCARLKQNARDLADHVAVAQEKTNKLKSQWLAAVVTGDLSYRVSATANWAALSTVVGQGMLATFEYGVADWSGTHLGFWDYETMFLLSAEMDLGNTKSTLEQGVASAAQTYDRARLGLWDLTRDAHGKPNAAALADGKLRMIEIPCPKPSSGRVDQSKDPTWVMSPYPALFWKNDWTTTDRTQGLRGVPMFEGPGWTSTAWKSNMMGYEADARRVRYHGLDYLTAYWYARQYGLVTPAE